jgi:hypothetical protein
MRLSKLLVEPHPAALNSILPPPLRFLDLTCEVFLSVMESITEAFHIR